MNEQREALFGEMGRLEWCVFFAGEIVSFQTFSFSIFFCILSPRVPFFSSLFSLFFHFFFSFFLHFREAKKLFFRGTNEAIVEAE